MPCSDPKSWGAGGRASPGGPGEIGSSTVPGQDPGIVKGCVGGLSVESVGERAHQAGLCLVASPLVTKHKALVIAHEQATNLALEGRAGRRLLLLLLLQDTSQNLSRAVRRDGIAPGGGPAGTYSPPPWPPSMERSGGGAGMGDAWSSGEGAAKGTGSGDGDGSDSGDGEGSGDADRDNSGDGDGCTNTVPPPGRSGSATSTWAPSGTMVVLVGNHDAASGPTGLRS